MNKLAGKYVLFLLKRFKTFRYNERFYANGCEILESLLRVEFGLEERDPQPTAAVNEVLSRLKEDELIKITELPERMSNGELDRQITLSEVIQAYLSEEEKR